jgi:histone H3/H4
MSSEINYKIYIRELLGQVSPGTGISSGAMHTMNELVKSTIIDITRIANELTLLAGK